MTSCVMEHNEECSCCMFALPEVQCYRQGSLPLLSHGHCAVVISRNSRCFTRNYKTLSGSSGMPTGAHHRNRTFYLTLKSFGLSKLRVVILCWVFPVEVVMELFSSSLPLPDRLWGTPSLLSSGHQGSYSERKVAWARCWPLIFI